MIEAPLSWIKEIQTTLIDAGAIPLSGYAPAFPWEALSQKIAELLQSPDVKISLRQTTVLKGPDVLKGFGAGCISIALDLTPLNGQAFWVMGKEDVATFTTMALTQSPGIKGFSSAKFQEGFYYYLCTEIVQTANEINALGDLSISMASPALPPEEESLCIDVEIKFPQRTLWGRLVCPASVHETYKTHFSHEEPPPLTSAFASQMDVTVRVELGQTHLTVSQWKNVHVGDFILLERCTFDPLSKKGNALLMLEQTPLLRARIKDSSLKIIDYALYREEEHTMNPEIPPEDEHTEHEAAEEEFISDVESEETTEHLWSPEDGEVEKMISAKEIPLTLTVEVARMRINLEKLLQLAPGNVLELPVRPEQGVDIVISGKKVAKAELIQLGDMLGLKILQLGE